MSKYIILSARPYDFTNDKQERVQGLKLSYLNPGVQKEDVLGFEPMIASVPSGFEVNLSEVPGRYNMEFEVVSGQKNRPVLQLTSLDFIEPINF
ncbi:MAG: hypothetical protein PHT77_13105 [Bacteroidales bacterium]|nr:hypothetical protein [Bacteroidales bacterium]